MPPVTAPEQLSDLIKIRRDGDSALVILNRPEKRNALSIDLREVLAETVDRLAPQVNAIGLTGAGSAFCAGMDVTQFGGDGAHRRRLVQSSGKSIRPSSTNGTGYNDKHVK